VILYRSRMSLSSLCRLGTLELSRKFFFVAHRAPGKLSHLRLSHLHHDEHFTYRASDLRHLAI
jgi:hypothetical protein